MGLPSLSTHHRGSRLVLFSYSRIKLQIFVYAAKTATGARMAKLKHKATKNNRRNVLMRLSSFASSLIKRILCRFSA